MRTKLVHTVGFGVVFVLLFASTLVASHKQTTSVAHEEHAIRTLISRWVEAYQELDAKRLAALETPDVQIVDRFGGLHLPSERNEDEKLWSDTFEMLSRTTPPPTVAIEHIQFLRPDVALVQASWRFPRGIVPRAVPEY